LLTEFIAAVESRAVGNFWLSRKRGRLRQRPEEIAQGLLAMFFKGVLREGGYVLREIESGTGYIDVSILLSRALHLAELKVLRGRLDGVEQLAVYMKQESRTEGWLVVFDARRADKRKALPADIKTASGLVRVLVVDINPVAPSKRKRQS
jgi:hypothetical protein